MVDAPDVAALLPVLEGDDEAAWVKALDAVAALPVEQLDWKAVFTLAGGLEKSPALAARTAEVIASLEARKVSLQPVFQRCINVFRWGKPGRGPARQMLGRLLQTSRATIDPGPYVSDLVELLKVEEVAELAIAWLDRAVELQPSGVVTSLFIRWTEIPADRLKQLGEVLDRRDPSVMKRAERKQPEKTPLSVEQVLSLVPPGSGPFFVAEGQMPKDGSIRVFVLSGAKLLTHAWMKEGGQVALASALAARGPVRRGECDAMYATPMSAWWTTDGGPFELWIDDARTVWFEGGALQTNAGAAYPRSAIANIEGYLEQGWVVRGVRINLKSGERLELRKEEDPIAGIDFTYDGLNLLMDTGWVHSLVRALEKQLGVPVVLDKDLA
jgi:hypothetical protein